VLGFSESKNVCVWCECLGSLRHYQLCPVPIIEGVDDESYGRGVSLIKAHGECLTKNGADPPQISPWPTVKFLVANW
jgi:hypothetical protein